MSLRIQYSIPTGLRSAQKDKFRLVMTFPDYREGGKPIVIRVETGLRALRRDSGGMDDWYELVSDERNKEDPDNVQKRSPRRTLALVGLGIARVLLWETDGGVTPAKVFSILHNKTVTVPDPIAEVRT
jgi:hypothetical protein